MNPLPLELAPRPTLDQLAQLRPSATTAELLYAPSISADVHVIIVANRSSAAATYSIFWDDDGSVWDDDTVIGPAVRLPAYAVDMFRLPDGIPIPMPNSKHTLGCSVGTANAINFTVVGREYES